MFSILFPICNCLYFLKDGIFQKKTIRKQNYWKKFKPIGENNNWTKKPIEKRHTMEKNIGKCLKIEKMKTMEKRRKKPLRKRTYGKTIEKNEKNKAY